MRPMRGWLSGGVCGLYAFWWWSTIERCPPLRWLVACRVHRRLARVYETARQTVDDHQNTTPDSRRHHLASVDIYIYGYETARERETRIRPETVARPRVGEGRGGRSRRQAQRSVRRNTTSTEAQGAAPEKERRERRRVGRRRRERGDETTRRPRV